MVPQRLDLLTSWRFFAAMLVVISHCGRAPFQAFPDWFQRLAQNGYQAVSFFFVLSGFILVYNYYRADRSSGMSVAAGRFWIARIARIYPSYLLSLGIALPAFLFYLFVRKAIPSYSLVQDEFSLPGFFSLSLVSVPILVQAWLPPAALAWNGPAWSLSAEACFYLSFPQLIRWIRLKSPGRCFWYSLTLVVVVQLGRHFACPLPESGAVPYEPTMLHHFFAYFPLFHLPTFIFGMALGKVYLSTLAKSAFRYQSAALLLCSSALMFLFCNHGKIAPLFLSDAVMVPLYGAVVFSSASVRGTLRRITLMATQSPPLVATSKSPTKPS